MGALIINTKHKKSTLMGMEWFQLSRKGKGMNKLCYIKTTFMEFFS